MSRIARIAGRGALLLVTVAQRPVAAQNLPRVGELVEARIVGPSDSLAGKRCTAWIGAVAGDTLLLNRSASCAPGSHLARIRAHTDDRGSRLKHAGVGLLAGALVGGSIGRIMAGDGCTRPGGCDDREFAIGVITLAGTVTGGLVGGLLGLAMPAGRRWIEMRGERPIRVGAVDVRPAIRVSLDERRR